MENKCDLPFFLNLSQYIALDINSTGSTKTKSLCREIALVSIYTKEKENKKVFFLLIYLQTFSVLKAKYILFLLSINKDISNRNTAEFSGISVCLELLNFWEMVLVYKVSWNKCAVSGIKA